MNSDDIGAWPKVRVIIPAYKDAADLHQCLAGLRTMSYPNWRLVVVNNFANDGTVEMVRSVFPEALVIENDHNGGYAGGVVRGWQEVKNDCTYIAIVTQDVIVDANWLPPIIRYLEEHELVGAAQSAVYRLTDREVINTVGNHINFLGFGYADGEGVKAGDDPRLAELLTVPHEVTYASGAALVVRGSAINKVGLFQEHFFMYHEDLDLGWRLALAGYKSVLIPESKVFHRYEFHRSTAIKYEFGERNRLLCLLENYHWWTLMLISPMLFVMEVAILTLSLSKGWFPLKLRGYVYIIKKWPEIRQIRRLHQGLRTKSDRVVTASFVGGIDYQQNAPALLRLANPFLSVYWALVRGLLV